ncbi:MAG: hypothetical protein U9O98_03175 [Asgard group archaeon]|nr:hypothetical protein [Asgard group archaeon]
MNIRNFSFKHMSMCVGSVLAFFLLTGCFVLVTKGVLVRAPRYSFNNSSVNNSEQIFEESPFSPKLSKKDSNDFSINQKFSSSPLERIMPLGANEPPLPSGSSGVDSSVRYHLGLDQINPLTTLNGSSAYKVVIFDHLIYYTHPDLKNVVSKVVLLPNNGDDPIEEYTKDELPDNLFTNKTFSKYI